MVTGVGGTREADFGVNLIAVRDVQVLLQVDVLLRVSEKHVVNNSLGHAGTVLVSSELRLSLGVVGVLEGALEVLLHLLNALRVRSVVEIATNDHVAFNLGDIVKKLLHLLSSDLTKVRLSLQMSGQDGEFFTVFLAFEGALHEHLRHFFAFLVLEVLMLDCTVPSKLEIVYVVEQGATLDAVIRALFRLKEPFEVLVTEVILVELELVIVDFLQQDEVHGVLCQLLFYQGESTLPSQELRLDFGESLSGGELLGKQVPGHDSKW